MEHLEWGWDGSDPADTVAIVPLIYHIGHSLDAGMDAGDWVPTWQREDLVAPETGLRRRHARSRRRAAHP